MLLLTGLAAGVAGGLLMRLLRATERAAFAYPTGNFLTGTQQASAERKIFVLLAAGLLVGGVGVLLNRMKDHGDLTESIWLRDGRVPLLRTMVQAVLSILIVGMGASVGREGALKQTGGVAANIFADWLALPDDQRRLLVACGAGAGMAAAYNVPLGGALFAMEVLLGTMSIRLALPALAASFLATWASWLLLPDQPAYQVLSSGSSLSLFTWALVAGPLCGLVSVPFIRVMGWATATKPGGLQAIILPLIVFASIGAIAIRYPEVLGNGKDVVQLAFLNQSSASLLFVLLILRPIATAAVLRSGAPGGLFTPTMTFGALFGLLLGKGWAAFWPQAEMGSYALIGSAAVLAAATQGPVSSLVFLLELTRHADDTMVPLLVAVVSATLVTRIFESRSIYSIDIEPRQQLPGAERGR